MHDRMVLLTLAWRMSLCFRPTSEWLQRALGKGLTILEIGPSIDRLVKEKLVAKLNIGYFMDDESVFGVLASK